MHPESSAGMKPTQNQLPRSIKLFCKQRLSQPTNGNVNEKQATVTRYAQLREFISTQDTQDSVGMFESIGNAREFVSNEVKESAKRSESSRSEEKKWPNVATSLHVEYVVRVCVKKWSILLVCSIRLSICLGTANTVLGNRDGADRAETMYRKIRDTDFTWHLPQRCIHLVTLSRTHRHVEVETKRCEWMGFFSETESGTTSIFVTKTSEFPKKTCEFVSRFFLANKQHLPSAVCTDGVITCLITHTHGASAAPATSNYYEIQFWTNRKRICFHLYLRTDRV